MKMGNGLTPFLLLSFCFAYGIFASIWPNKIVTYYQKFGWVSENPLLGGYYYSTPKRARITGIVLAFSTFIVAIIAIRFRYAA